LRPPTIFFDRSEDVQRLDRALRATGSHPLVFSDAVKLTTLKLLKGSDDREDIDQHQLESAAQLLGYCTMGPDEFAETKGPWECAAVETRLVAAFAGDERSVDEELVLLMFCAGLMHPDLVQLYGLKVIS
jgi:hypothetical protein